jgi:hypothetical protein
MLHCNMTTSLSIQLGLEDLLADLHHARRHQELGRLALLAYCEVRSWARQAGESDISEHSTQIFTQDPCTSREDFLAKVDLLIAALEQLQADYPGSAANQVFNVGERGPQSKLTQSH